MFHVGVDPDVGANDHPTPEQKATFDAAVAKMVAGDFKDQFAKIKKDAYSS